MIRKIYYSEPFQCIIDSICYSITKCNAHKKPCPLSNAFYKMFSNYIQRNKLASSLTRLSPSIHREFQYQKCQQEKHRLLMILHSALAPIGYTLGQIEGFGNLEDGSYNPYYAIHQVHLDGSRIVAYELLQCADERPLVHSMRNEQQALV